MYKPKVLVVIGSYDGCAMWRAIQPVEALASHDYPCAWRDRFAQDIDKQTHFADVVILERIYWQPGHGQEMEGWFGRVRTTHHQRAIIYECDDDTITEESKKHTRLFHNDWTDQDAEDHRVMNLEAMKRCDAITTTNELLANLMREQTERPVYVLPNAIRWNSWRRSWVSKQRTITDKLVIGWAGGWRIKEDLAPMMEAWQYIAEHYPQVHFILAGSIHPDYKEILPPDRMTVRDWVPVSQYPHQYADFDIACCPLTDLPFNRMKSPCKAFEAGAAQCAVVASPVVYGHVIDDKKNGLIAYTTDEWIAALELLINNQKLRVRLARRWMERVEQRHNLDRNCWQWSAVWQDVYKNTTCNTESNLVAV